MSKAGIKDHFLTANVRAEDIILGSTGIGEDATIESIEKRQGGYRGVARFADGESVVFESEDPISELERWALEILLSPTRGQN